MRGFLLLSMVFPMALSDCLPSSIPLTSLQWVPSHPVPGTAAYIQIHSRSLSDELLPVSYCRVKINGQDLLRTEDGAFSCFYGLVQEGKEVKVQTGAIWVPGEMEEGTYEAEVQLMDGEKKEIACGSDQVSMEKTQKGSCDSENQLNLNVETWIPIQPVIGRASYLILEGDNQSSLESDLFSCSVLLTQGEIAISPPQALSCYAGRVEPGGNFRVQTNALWIPSDVPSGDYVSLIEAFASTGEKVACWRGVVTLTQ